MNQPALIAQLKGELLTAQERVVELQRQLETLRVKCPTCRCRILPGDECVCCKYSPPDEVEPLL